MAYRENLLRHLMAPLTGEGLSDQLARDFWHADEDLWTIEHEVRWRWLKLVWVYSASGVAQLTLFGVVAFALIGFFKFVSLPTWWVGIAGATAFALTLAVVVATVSWVDIRRHRARRTVDRE